MSTKDEVAKSKHFYSAVTDCIFGFVRTLENIADEYEMDTRDTIFKSVRFVLNLVRNWDENYIYCKDEVDYE